MTHSSTLPVLFAPPESIQRPALSDFRKLPASRVMPGDLLLLGGRIYRVKARQTLKSSKVRFTLFPIIGGRAESETFFPRQWLDCARGF